MLESLFGIVLAFLVADYLVWNRLLRQTVAKAEKVIEELENKK